MPRFEPLPGRRPALVHIDLANAWTRPGHAFSCDGMDEIIPAVQALNEAGRAKGIPIVYTTTAYADVEGPNSDMGLWVHKIPVELLALGTEAVEIDRFLTTGRLGGGSVIIQMPNGTFTTARRAELGRI